MHSKMIQEADKKKIVHEYLVKREAEEEVVYKGRLHEVHEFGLSVGIIRDILKAKTVFWRIVWFCLALAALGVCVNFLRISLQNFIDGPTNTKITYKVKNSIKFPLVTVCTYARLNASEVKRLNLSNELVAYMMSTFKGMYLFYNDFNYRNRDDIEKAYQRFRKSQKDFSLTKFFNENGFKCQHFLRGCMFQGMDFDCCQGQRQLGDIGKCFVVKSEKFPNQEIPGPSGGLKININNWMSEYTETLISTNPDMGIQIHIIHPDDSAMVGVSPLIVFPGTHAMIRLDAVYQKLLKSNKEDSCTDDKELGYFGTYSFEGCFTECIADLTRQTCGCFQIGMVPDLKLTEQDLCTPEVATACVQPLLQANNMGFLWDIYDITERCKCPLPCSQWSYETAVSYSRVPNDGYKIAKDEWLAKEENFTKNSEDYIILDLFFDNLVYREINEQELVTTTILLSQVGGQLSIWLGVRLITICHMFYYGTVMLFGLCPVWKMKIQQRLRKKKVKKLKEDEEKLQEEATVDSPPSYHKTVIQISPAMESRENTENKEGKVCSPGYLDAPHPLIAEKITW